jgi:hypothetical protein
MPPLPDTINTTYVQGTTPEIQAQDLNDLQKWLAEAWAIQRHASYSFVEDFDGTDSGATSFTNNHFSSSGAANNWVGGFDDSAQNSVGAVRFNHGFTQANTLLSPNWIALGQSDLWLTARLRIPQIGGANSSVFFGLYDFGGTTSQLLMIFNPTLNGNSNWWLWYGLSASSLKADTGVARGTTTQQIIDVVRTAGVITVAINGSQVASVSPSPFNLTFCQHAINAAANTSGTTEAIVDYYKVWARTAR